MLGFPETPRKDIPLYTRKARYGVHPAYTIPDLHSWHPNEYLVGKNDLFRWRDKGKYGYYLERKSGYIGPPYTNHGAVGKVEYDEQVKRPYLLHSGMVCSNYPGVVPFTWMMVARLNWILMTDYRPLYLCTIGMAMTQGNHSGMIHDYKNYNPLAPHSDDNSLRVWLVRTNGVNYSELWYNNRMQSAVSNSIESNPGWTPSLAYSAPALYECIAFSRYLSDAELKSLFSYYISAFNIGEKL